MKKTLSKTLLDLQWKWFTLALLTGLITIPIGCAFSIYFIENDTLSLKEIVLVSISYTLGVTVYSVQSIELRSASEYVVLFTNFLSYIWLALSTAFLVTRISDNKKRPRLSPLCGIYFHDGSGHIDERPGRYLLEFRLIVHPNPEIYKPDIAVTMYLTTERGRDQIPLELTPVQANKVSAYLTFRAILPEKCLNLSIPNHINPVKFLPKTSVDVSISMIDSASDGKIFLYKNYKIPNDVISGSFRDAVSLDAHGQIKLVLSKYLDVIKEENNLNLFYYKEIGVPSNKKGRFPKYARAINPNNIDIVSVNEHITIEVDLGDELTEGLEIVPCLSIASENSFGYQVTLRYTIDNDTFNVSLCAIGNYENQPRLEESSTHVSSEVDLLLIKSRISNPKVIIELTGISKNELSRIYSLVTISIFNKNNPELKHSLKDNIELEIPQKSQMTFPSEIRNRICSPTSISMVQGYYGKETDVLSVAEKAYCKKYDMYGIWPQNIWAMKGNRLSGYVSKLNGFGDIEYFLLNSIPIIASINYKEGELTNAAIEKTPGHLVVITGLTNDNVIVNDPAAGSLSSVRRLYSLSEFKKAWLDKRGIVYIIYPYQEEY